MTKCLVVSGPPIEDLRKDFQQSQQLISTKSPEPLPSDIEAEESNTVKVVQTIPLTPMGDDEKEGDIQPIIRDDEDDEEYDHNSDEEMIKGVYCDDEQGNPVEIQWGS